MLSDLTQITLLFTIITIAYLSIGQVVTGVSRGQQDHNNNSLSNIENSSRPSNIGNIPPKSSSTERPSVDITSPPFPATITTGKIMIQGTAKDTVSGIRTVSASAHVFPFNGYFSVKLASPVSPTTDNNWSSWSVPLIINTTGTYRVVVTATNNAGNYSYAETTINAALPGKTPAESSTTMMQGAKVKIAFVRPTFTEAAYRPHGFYTFYYKYMFPPLGTNITTDLDMLTVRTPPSIPEDKNETVLRHLSNFTSLLPTDPNLQKFWVPLTNHTKEDAPNAIVTVMRDEDVNEGHIFNASNNKSNAYDILLLLHNEYVTQAEYNNLKRFVENGGKIVFIDGNVFYAQVSYNKQNHTITLVKGHDWQFDGKLARRSAPERWYNETKQWVGGNFLVNNIHDNITFGNNPFNYTHFEEQFVNNPKDKVLINYDIKFPKDYLQHEVLPSDKPNGNFTVATYTLNYGKGKIIMIGLYGQNLVNNKSFLGFFDKLFTNEVLSSNLQSYR
jgi:hypothetical protein